MTLPAILFSHDAFLSSNEEAPQRTLASQRHSSCYRAILKKRIGTITSKDFMKYARRLASLCEEIYQGSILTLQKDKSIPTGREVFVASRGAYEGNPGEPIDLEQLTDQSFLEIFKYSSSMVLCIKPSSACEDTLSSFAQIKWTHKRPRTIFFYAQQGGRYDLATIERPLENLLLRKLFHVPGSAPSMNFIVKLGVADFLNELEGKLS